MTIATAMSTAAVGTDVAAVEGLLVLASFWESATGGSKELKLISVQVNFYTGLPSLRSFLKAVFDFVLPPTEYFNKNPTKLIKNS